MSVLPQKSMVVDETAERIVAMIREGEVAPGDKLPGERQLSQMLGVGRTSVREAIRKLEVMGVVEVRHSRGTYVAAPSAAAAMTLTPPPILTDARQLQELYEVRRIIEVAAASLAAQRAGSEQLTMMQHWLQALETCAGRNDAEGIVIADVEFHRQIMMAAGNSFLLSLMDDIVDLLKDMRYASANIPDLIPQILVGHRSIFAAITQRDEQAAAKAMENHLADIRARVTKFWLENPAPDTATPGGEA